MRTADVGDSPSAEKGSLLNTLSAQSSREILRGRDFRISCSEIHKGKDFYTYD
jgi:hypothetical protein